MGFGEKAVNLSKNLPMFVMFYQTTLEIEVKTYNSEDIKLNGNPSVSRKNSKHLKTFVR